MSNKKQNGAADPIEQMRQQQQQVQPGTVLAGALHTLLGAHTHEDVINACFIIAAARAKMAGMRRADFRTGAGQVFDGIEVQRQEPSAALVRP